MENVAIDKIVADDNQPRKLFAAEKMARLRDSVRRYGIMNPLKVEKMADGKYKLLDGERRFRTARELKLREVPVIVSKSVNDVDRLIKQFHIQQQHEDWSNIEKAMAITQLSEDTGMGIKELCESLAMPDKTISRYLQFGKLADKESFVKSEISMDWASIINGVNVTARIATNRELGKSYTSQDEKELEKAIVSRIVSGEFRRSTDISKLKDIFRTDPSAIRKFVDSPKTTAMELFVKTGASGASYFRTTMNYVRAITSAAGKFLETKDFRVDEVDVRQLKSAKEAISKIIALAE